MGAGYIRICCQSSADEVLMKKVTLVNDYYVFAREKWFTFHNPILFQPNKFIFLYPQYEEIQTQLLNHWRSYVDIRKMEYGESRTDDDVMSVRWKHALRRGVPVQYYKPIISVIFNKNFTISDSKKNYQQLKERINDADKNIINNFEGDTFKELTHAPYLNQKGIYALKELLMLIYKKKGGKFYNKYLPHIAGLLLIFFADHEAYELLSTMIDESSKMSNKKAVSLHWHFLFTEQQMNSLTDEFYAKVGRRSESFQRIEQHFTMYQIDRNEFFKYLCQQFFYGILPFPVILTVFMLFLSEGVKIFLRICWILISQCESQLLDAQHIEKCFAVLRKKYLNFTSLDWRRLIRKSFTVKISDNLLKKLSQKSVSFETKYYLPFTEGVSEILSPSDVQKLWNFLPIELKDCNLKLKYSRNSSKRPTLAALLSSIENEQHSLVVVQEQEGCVFGCFIKGGVPTDSSPSNYLFALKPESMKYPCCRSVTGYFKANRDVFEVGKGANGDNAIAINSNLCSGSTFQSSIYENPPLSTKGGQFRIRKLESFSVE